MSLTDSSPDRLISTEDDAEFYKALLSISEGMPKTPWLDIGLKVTVVCKGNCAMAKEIMFRVFATLVKIKMVDKDPCMMYGLQFKRKQLEKDMKTGRISKPKQPQRPPDRLLPMLRLKMKNVFGHELLPQHFYITIELELEDGTYRSTCGELPWDDNALFGHELVNIRANGKGFFGMSVEDTMKAELQNPPPGLDPVEMLASLRSGANPSVCKWCHGKTPKASKCGGCRQACYCSTDCQRKDWPKHKKGCNYIRAMYEERVADAQQML